MLAPANNCQIIITDTIFCPFKFIENFFLVRSKIFYIIILFFISATLNLRGESRNTSIINTSGPGETTKEPTEMESGKSKLTPKSGYNLAPFPEFMIDPSVGLYVGINATLFDFGNGSNYPNYNKLINLNAAWGTKGKTNISLRYKQLGKNMFSAEVGHSVTNLQSFYGFNGYQTRYNRHFEEEASSNFITSTFYNYRQKKSSVKFYFQNRLGNTHINWQAGMEVSYYNTSRVDYSKLNKNTEGLDLIKDTTTLFDLYEQWNLISQQEKNGGWANSLRLGFLYDSRNKPTNPDKGIWSQLTFRYFPTFAGNYHNGFQLSIKHHQYINIIPKRINFAYRLRYDAVFGNLAFYHRQVLADDIEGYGGANGKVGEGFGTIWGIKQNRVIGKRMALANLEIRAKLLEVRFLKQNWQLTAVPIYHSGLIIKPFDMDLSTVSAADKEKYFTDSYKGWYNSAGLGFKIVMNENIVIGLDWATPFNSDEGTSAIYVGLGYTF